MEVLQFFHTLFYFGYYLLCTFLFLFRGYPKPHKVYPPNLRSAVFISAAGKGVGAHAALTLVQQGYLVFAGVRKESEGRRLEQHSVQVKSIGLLVPIVVDITSGPSRTAAYWQVLHVLQYHAAKLVLLVNNAGNSICLPVELVPPHLAMEMMKVHVLGVVGMCQTFLPLLKESQGRIINMSGLAGYNPVPGMGHLSACKHALEAVTDCLRQELQSFQVCVVLIEPGPFKSPQYEKVKAHSYHTYQQTSREQQRLYDDQFYRLSEMWLEEAVTTALSPVHVTNSIQSALRTRFPLNRYYVGLDAWVLKLQSCLFFVPDIVKEYLWLKVLQAKKYK